jgi:hypothetical protein
MAKNKAAVTEKTKAEILEIVADKKPANTQELITIISNKYSFSEKELADTLLDLEYEGKISFAKNQGLLTWSTKAYLLSKTALWFWLILAFEFVTTVAIFVIPGNVYPLSYLRVVLGVCFVAFIPGFVFIKALFNGRVKGVGSENMGIIEKIVLSMVMSFIFTSVSAFILTFTSWGVSLVPIVFSLLGLTLVLTVFSLTREIAQAKKPTSEKSKPDVRISIK